MMSARCLSGKVTNWIIILSSIVLLAPAVQAAKQPNRSVGEQELHLVKIQLHERYGTPEIMSGRFAAPIGKSRSEQAHSFIANRRSDFRLAQPARELQLMQEHTDELGMTHLRFQQEYEGLRVWGCQTIVHFDQGGSIYLVGGQTISTPGVTVNPTVLEADARTTALAQIKGRVTVPDLVTTSELIVYPNDGDPRLAYLVTITSPSTGAVRWLVFVDALTGDVLHDFNNLHFDGPDVGTGVDVQGVMQTFPIYEQGGVYRLTDDTHTGTINTYDDYYSGGPISTDPDGDKIWDDYTAQQAEVSGHYNIGLTYDYFLNTFGLDSYDGLGHDIVVNVHDPYYTNNAYWNGEGVNFADGDGVNYLPFSGALDVVAHELAHGVTDYSADLIYSRQSGALNESYSDFFGAMVDRDDWLLGEDIRLAAPGFMRSMEDPSLRGHPMHMDDYRNYDISYDNGGVHINSGIPNHAGYQYATRVGRDIAEQVWYRTLTQYLTPSSGFYFWAGMLTQSAIDLYGGGIEVPYLEMSLGAVGLSTAYALPQSVSLTATIGGTDSKTIWIHNPGPGAKSITAQLPTLPGVTLTHVGGADPANVTDGDSTGFELILDAGSFDECSIGKVMDTLRFEVGATMYIKLPMTAAIGLTTTSAQFKTVSTQCLVHDFMNTSTMYNLRPIDQDPVLHQGSLLVGLLDGAEPTVYRTLYSTARFAPVDMVEIEAGNASFRISANDARIQGSVTYSYDPDVAENCDFIIADYSLYNPCDTPLTILPGLFCNFDIDNFITNYASLDAGSDMIYMRNSDDTKACGLALLSGSARNLRAINNPLKVWNDGLSDETAYDELAAATNVEGASPNDWSTLLSFGETTLGSNDTIDYQVALLYSGSGSSGLNEVLSRAQVLVGGCECPDYCDLDGEAGLTPVDAVYIVNYVYKSLDSRVTIPDCPGDNGDWNCDGSINPVDVVYYVNYVYKDQGSGPCDPCACTSYPVDCP